MPSDRRAPEELAEAVLRRLGMSAEPPIDIERLAAGLGAQLEFADLVEDGRLEMQRQQPRIVLRRDAPQSRSRFTAAHEVGHLLHTQPLAGAIVRRDHSGNDAEERYCDAFSAALLMPRSWITHHLAESPEVLSVARYLANACLVSLSAAVVRLQEVLGWSLSLLHWRRVDGQWRIQTTAGVPKSLHGRINTARETRCALDLVTSKPQRIRLPILAGGELCVVRAELERRGSAVIALADLRECLESSRTRGATAWVIE